MIYLSKSKYCGLWQCPKIAWLRKYKPEEWVLDDGTLARMDAGNEVGDLAIAEKILQSEEEPDIDLNMGCHRRVKSERHG